MKTALIALEDGTTFTGRAFAGDGEYEGELVFNTSMSGYQEILTDPSYRGQLVTLTYPLIGNYGINPEDNESWQPHAAGLVIGECSQRVSNWRATQSLPEYLEEHGLIGIDQVDCRQITLHIRRKGAMKCMISTQDLDPASLTEKARLSKGLVGRDLASEVSTDTPYTWNEKEAGNKPYRIAAIDCGVKYNQFRILESLGCAIDVFPNQTPAEEILERNPDGIFISNGPGDPSAVEHTIGNLKKLIHSGTPLFGICFGHQLTARALGAQTFKLKFGHRGANQPVIDLRTGKVEITSQNHGFCVDKDTLPDGVETSHINLNDQTSEGLRHKELPVFTVQYHPEARPGPNDAAYLFEEFMDLIKQHKN